MSVEYNDIADAVASALTTFASGAYTPIRAYVPNWSDDDLATLRCAVIPQDAETLRVDRTQAEDVYAIDVGFAKRLQNKTRSELDGIAEIVHAAFKHLASTGAGSVLTTTGGLRVRSIGVKYKAIFDPDRLAAKAEGGDGDASGAFLSVFTVTYKALP